MGRHERALDTSTGLLYTFARDLRALRRSAGQPSYRQLAAATHFSVTTLARAANGRRLPTLKVTLAYVMACGGDRGSWRDRWHSVARQLGQDDLPAPLGDWPGPVVHPPVLPTGWSVPPVGGLAVPAAWPGPPIERAAGWSGPIAGTPVQLPPVPRGFVGRHVQIAELDALLTEVAGAKPPVLAAIVGGPGAGKTALAVHWAYRIRNRFPHGVLFADLHGYDPRRTPVDPGVQLETFLRGVGVPTASIPLCTDARSAMWRSIMGSRQVLLILDNAASAEQVRPLLATGSDSVTLVTNRAQLSGIVARDGAARIVLGTMTDAEAEQLLRCHLAPEQRQAPADLLHRMAQFCAGLPLALRVAAERAAQHPRTGVSGFVRQLAREETRLDLLNLDDEQASLRAAFASSYRTLRSPEASIFRLIGLGPGSGISIRAACAMTGSPPSRTRCVLERLICANLVEEPKPGCFRTHDLLRLYAREQADREDPPAARRKATRRLISWHLRSAGVQYHWRHQAYRMKNTYIRMGISG